MKIQRCLPPVAAPFSLRDLGNALVGLLAGKRTTERLEAELKTKFNVNHVFLVSSGKAALTLILLALKSISSRKEVLIPAYTCYSVPSAILKADLHLAVCDVEPNGFEFHGPSAEQRIGEQTLCVVSNHLFGIPSRLDRLHDICRRNGVVLVEDAAQAMGGMDSGRPLGTLGDVGFFSLGRGKNLACGSGGIILTNSDTIAAAIQREYAQLAFPSLIETGEEFLHLVLTALFVHPSLFWFPQGLPFLKLGETIFYRDFPIKKLSAMKAGLLRHWQARLEWANRVRVESSEVFAKHLRLHFHAEVSLPLLRLPVILENCEARARLLSLSRDKGLGLSGMYPTPVHQIDELRSLFGKERFPSAEAICERLVTLPTHPLMTRKDRDEICALLDEFTVQGCGTMSSRPNASQGNA